MNDCKIIADLLCAAHNADPERKFLYSWEEEFINIYLSIGNQDL